MNLKQAQTVLADILRQCQRERVALPADPLDAVLAALRALRHEATHELGRPQIEAAMAAMRQQYGVSSKDKDDDQDKAHESPRKTPQRKQRGHSALQREVLSQRAACDENQPLVEQLVQLGEFELAHGHTQRGVARLRAAKQVRDAADVISSGAQARQLDRVGASAAAKIDALLHGGLESALREYQG